MRTGTVFYKMTGSGNDFVVFDGRYSGRADFTPQVVRTLCDRRQGIGADGLILLDPEAPDGTHFSFWFWNSDGSAAPMCGNGALCATRLATLIGLAPAAGEVRFATPAGVHQGRVLGERAEIWLPDCDGPRLLPGVKTAPGERSPMAVSPSVPHLVLLVDDVDRVSLEQRGRPLRNDPALDQGGANVNWVSTKEDGTFRMRSYERGVEAETLACATGAVACALALEAQGLARSPARFWTRTGLPLDVSWERHGDRATSIRLSGEARLAYRGILEAILNNEA